MSSLSKKLSEEAKAAKKKPASFKAKNIPGTMPGGKSRETGKKATVEVSDGHVKVQWLTGSPVYFTPEDLKEAIDHTVATNDKHPTVYLALTDSKNHPFVAQIRDGRLYAEGGPEEEYPSVVWTQMKLALEAAIKFLQSS